MTKIKMNSKDPDKIAPEKALHRVARRALKLALQTGTPVYVIKEGKIVDLTKQARHKAKAKIVPAG